jgi:hypothetical protein
MKTTLLDEGMIEAPINNLLFAVGMKIGGER